MHLHCNTPLIQSRRLLDNASIRLKLENIQPSGSFKTRGIGFACQQYVKNGASRFISSSGGNAGLAVAYSGRVLQVPVTVIVPETTSEKAKSLIQREDAQVVVHGASWAEAHEEALRRMDEHAAYLHPFDDPFLWQGHATIVEEISEQIAKPDAVVLSVGGGGLYAGVVEGLRKVGWETVPVFAVETKGADSMAQSLEQGKLIELSEISSIATSLGAKRIADHAFELALVHPTRSFVVSDKEAVQGCRALLDAHNLLVEPACGAAVSAAMDLVSLENLQDVVLIVCGGVGVSDASLRNWEQQFSAR